MPFANSQPRIASTRILKSFNWQGDSCVTLTFDVLAQERYDRVAMGLLDDAASAISGKPTKHHHHHKKHRSRSRSGSRERSKSFAGSIFGGSIEPSHHHHHKSDRHNSFSIFGNDKHHERHNASTRSFFSMGNASRGSFFGFSMSLSV
jgi:hypothetical protein